MSLNPQELFPSRFPLKHLFEVSGCRAKGACGRGLASLVLSFGEGAGHQRQGGSNDRTRITI